MKLTLRHKLTIAALLLYWPYIFIATHMRHVPYWARKMGVTDKTLHYLAYFVLAFLLWSAVSPDRKVSWRSAAVWWVLFVTVVYAVLDEWLQHYAGRTADVKDFMADMAGALSGLAILTVFYFWPAAMFLTGSAIFILTNFTQTDLAHLLPVTTAVFGFVAYGVFTLCWIQYMYYLLPQRPPEGRWVAGALIFPGALLLVVEAFAAFHGTGSGFQRVALSAGGITVAVGANLLVGLFRRWQGPTLRGKGRWTKDGVDSSQ